ncbi:MAG: thioredoxin-disulfide reductase [Gemmatimonadota bacterium]|nr:MAG: thioredoxin-disulfide reductase [Gemmatimonadota bacterium]
MENLIIMGSGPAGLSAALYASRSALEPIVIAGDQRGGQITLTQDMENYPGFPEGVGGFELAELMEKQAVRFGARISSDAVTEVDLSKQPFAVRTREKNYETKAVIIATGASPRTLDVPGEKEYTGKGVSYCATCDGFFYQDKSVVVVGGGDSAVDEGLFLTKFASKVTIVHRRNRLRADPILQERAKNNEKMAYIWDSVVSQVLGDDSGVKGVRLKNVKTDSESTYDSDGVFIYIGHIPNTTLFKDQLEMDEEGFLITDKRQKTSVEGVFAAGDVQDPVYKQAVTSAGTGAIAAIEAEKFIAELEGKAYPGK